MLGLAVLLVLDELGATPHKFQIHEVAFLGPVDWLVLLDLGDPGIDTAKDAVHGLPRCLCNLGGNHIP